MANLGSITIDEYCHPTTILWPGYKDAKWYATLGDNLAVKHPKWDPYIELNLARMHNDSKDVEDFIKKLDENWLAMYLEIALRCEDLFLDLRIERDKGHQIPSETKYINNMFNVVLGEKGTDKLPYVINLDEPKKS